jgi:uncharacterized protein DUF5985
VAAAVYVLCALTSITCAVLLFRAYAASRTRLLLLSAICFAGLGANNVLLVVDRLVVPEQDLSVPRVLSAFASMSVLLFGLVWEER